MSSSKNSALPITKLTVKLGVEPLNALRKHEQPDKISSKQTREVEIFCLLASADYSNSAHKL